MKHSLNIFVLGLCCMMAASAAYASGKKDKTASETKEAASEVVKETVADAEETVAAGASSASVPETASGNVLRVGSLNGPSSIPVAYMHENMPELGGTTATFELCATPVVELPKLLKGELDIGFLPPNAAAKVYTKNNGALIALGITGNGNIYLLTTDKTYTSIESLKGKKIAAAGQGSTPEYMFRWILGKKNIGIGDGADMVNIDFSIPTAELAAALISGKVSYALLPEPFATVASMKSADVKRVVDLQSEYEQIEGKGAVYPLTLLVCRASYAKEHADVVAKFIAAYKTATEWTNANPAKAGVLVQKYTLGLLAPIAAKSIPTSSFVWTDAQSGRGSIEKLLNIYLSVAPESVGGALPADGFYFSK
jgi:NitT/TauT family transport system substrate-binding protein